MKITPGGTRQKRIRAAQPIKGVRFLPADRSEFSVSHSPADVVGTIARRFRPRFSQLRRSLSGRDRSPRSGTHHLRRIAGRTKRRKVINAETGLPGNPNIAHCLARPKRNGLPGLTETRHKSVFAPTELSKLASPGRVRRPRRRRLITRTSCFEALSAAPPRSMPVHPPQCSARFDD